MPTLELLSAAALRATIVAFRDAATAHAAAINLLNVYPVPDGDTGTNMARTLDAVVAELDRAGVELDATCDAICLGSLMGARGNSGVILSQMLRGFANTLKSSKDATGAVVAEALTAAAVAAYQAVLKPIEGTILTVAREAAEGASVAAATGASLVGVLSAAQSSARIALARTPELLPVLKAAGVVDAGGAGLLLLLDAALHVVDGQPLRAPEEILEPAVHAPIVAANDVDGSELRYSELRYEVMFLLDLDDAQIDRFKHDWGQIGDSIVVVGGDGLWNCHVHTNDIGAAVEVALDLDGRPRRIRVTDLYEEVADEHARRDAAAHDAHGSLNRPFASLPRVTTAVVAVASGDGLVELFANLGVQGVVSGGQTLNPSTAELLVAVEAVNADQVVVLPNNTNIVAVAEQLDGLTTKRVVVVPTRSMPEALAALVAYDPEVDAVVNAQQMLAAANAVATGEITTAVRDTSDLDGTSQGDGIGPVRAGQWIGIVRGGGIVTVDDTVEDAATCLLDQLISPERELVTVITGADASARSTEFILAWLADQWPSVEVEVHAGGQPLYPYLFGVE